MHAQAASRQEELAGRLRELGSLPAEITDKYRSSTPKVREQAGRCLLQLSACGT
jgi:hypothetical protein